MRGSFAFASTPPVQEAERSRPASSPRLRARQIRVLIVDDSVVMRRLVSRALTEDPDFEVAGFAANGRAALEQAILLEPDAITMDIEMPEMDGLETVRRLRGMASKAVIVMCSTLTSRGARATIEALMSGANDYVAKPAAGAADAAFAVLRDDLRGRLKQFFAQPTTQIMTQLTTQSFTGGPAAARSARPEPVQIGEHPAGLSGAISTYQPEECRVVAIGVSTGGPAALMEILPYLPADFPVPVVIVQHMPPLFTRQLADRLAAVSKVRVVEATQGVALEAGQVLVAPGDFHMRLHKAGKDVLVQLDQEERENSCRPAVDALFRSVAEVYGKRALGVVLTGMGRDGLLGAGRMKEGGAYIMAQDRVSSVVWGMPGAVIEAGLADAVLSLKEVAAALLNLVLSR